MKSPAGVPSCLFAVPPNVAVSLIEFLMITGRRLG